MKRRTKIVATLGPVSRDETTITRLVREGVNVARLNFSHGTHKDFARMIRLIRKAAHRLGQPVCILQDLQGPKLRITEIAQGEVELHPGQSFTLTTESVPGDDKLVGVDFKELPHAVSAGSRILIDDGQVELKVTHIEGKQVETEVVIGGKLTSHKGINLPDSQLDIPNFTEKDEADLAFGLEHEVDTVAVSFVRTAEDVNRVRKAIARLAPERIDTSIIAKLERPEAVDNLEEIIHAADGVMVARGDLGVEMSPETVPVTQKRIIEAANQHAKLVITATQMLESMIHNPRPTRAEATDVANAIFDGSDALMLSGETAAGKYPLQAVRMMDAIICQAEQHLSQWSHWAGVPQETVKDDALALAHVARELAHDRDVAAIAVFTQTGRTAQLMSKVRPRVPILAFTPEQRTYQRLAFYWGVIPNLVPFADSVEAMLAHVETALMSTASLQPGQQVVVISGFPVGAMRPPNFALLHTVGQSS